MVFKSLILIIEISLLLFFLGYPLLKKRPFFIREFTGSLIILTVFSIPAIFVSYLLYIPGFVLGIFAYFFVNVWFILGISFEQIKTALEKAVLMTRSDFDKNNNEYEIKGVSKVSIIRIFLIKVIWFHAYQNTKKAELTKNVFRKFISNYYISF